MSTAGEAIARATAAGLRAARLAPLVHCARDQRDAVRWQLVLADTGQARRLRAELEGRWAAADARAARERQP